MYKKQMMNRGPQAPKMPKIAEPFKRGFYEFLSKQSAFKNNVIDDGYILRSPVLLKDGDNNYKFPIKVTDQRDPLAMGLEQNDVFFVTDIGFYLNTRNYADAEKTRITKVNAPYLWANPNEFTLSFESLTNIYTAGNLTLKIGTTQYRQALPMKKFLKVPTLQKGLFMADLAEGEVLADAYDDEQTVLARIPAISFVGTDSIDLQMNITGLDQLGLQNASRVVGTENFMTIEYYGFLIKDGANI